MLSQSLRTHRNMIPLDDTGLQSQLSIVDLLETLARLIYNHRTRRIHDKESKVDDIRTQELPKTITFPYSRHSSYAELCHFVSIFKPGEVFPCTVDDERWHEGMLT